MALYKATDGPNWTNSTKWLSEAPLGEWYGVTTDSSGRVIELDLQENQLSGEIPPELGSLIHLERLVLYGNELSGEIPPELGSLSNLQVLGLDGTQVSGCVPEGLGDTLIYNPLALRLPFCVTPITVEDLPEDGKVLAVLYEATGGENWWQDWNWLSALPLERWHGVTTDSSGRVIQLWLFENQLSGKIPPELGRLANLQLLILRQNQLSGGIPQELGRLSNLESLDLDDNQLSGEIPLELGSLPNLQSLSLSDNQLSGELPPEMGSLSNLQSLDLSDNQLSGEIPPELGSLSNLEWLDLGFNQLSGGIPPELGSLFNLELLHLSDNQLSGEIPSELGSLANLQRLFLQRNQLSGCVPQGLSGIPDTDLGTLGLPPCETRAAVAVEDLPEGGAALATLYEATGGANWKNNYNWLSGAPFGEWYGITTDSMGRITGLSLFGNGLGGGIPPELGSLSNLEGLDLGFNQLSGGIPPELGSLFNLQSLHLSGNQLSGEVPPELGSLPNLQWLGLSANQLIGELPRSLIRLPALQWFLFFNNPGICAPVDNAFQTWLNRIANVYGSSCAPMDSPEDRDVLAELHRATDGEGWTNSASWLSGRPIREWHGVVTDANGRVTGLLLSTNWLGGEIPPELGSLSNLEALDLSGNHLTGEIPPELGSLSNLQVLALFENQLSGGIPPELGSLANLQWLFLERNQLSGCVPEGLRDVPDNDFAELGLPFCATASP